MASYKVCVLGGGNAAGYFAKEFIASGRAGSDLAIITEEPVVAYERPALSKGYLAAEGAARLPGFHTCVGGGGERQPPEWYTEKGITYLTSTKVTAVDVAGKTLTLQSGQTVAYEALVVATGARPIYLTEFKMPGADLGGIHYLRNEADAAQLYEAIKATKESGGSVVIVGGGYIGMEVAAGIAGHGIKSITMVFPTDRLLDRLLTLRLAGYYEEFFASKGIKVVKKCAVTGFDGANGRVTSVVTEANGSSQEMKLPADLVVVGIGARPNTELFAGQLEMAPGGGIKVDGSMRTSSPSVYAIGDVAAFPLLPQYGGALARQEHVTHARQSAAQAVRALGGPAEPYAYLPSFYSRLFSLSWQFYGIAPADSEVVHFGDLAAGKFGAYWVKDGKVVGVFVESGSADENAAAKRVALEQPSAPADLEEQGLAFALGAPASKV